MHKTGKKLGIRLVVGIFLITFGILGRGMNVAASDYDYFGPLDSFTGERSDSADDGSAEQTVSNLFQLSDTMFFDAEKKLYGYEADLGTVYANVADGMVVRDKVKLTIPDGMPITVYRDGAVYSYDGKLISATGDYSVMLREGNEDQRLFSFTIVGAKTGKVLNYAMPDGFRITDATLNGETISYARKFVDMSLEGAYIIKYECSRSQVSYVLSVTVDMTPPELTLLGVDEDGKARGPVAITGSKDGDTVTVTKDGEVITMMFSNTLTQSGRYVVTAVDEAGNVSTYPFTIMIYLDRNGWIFSLLFLVVIIAVVAYIVYQRTHLKIR